MFTSSQPQTGAECVLDRRGAGFEGWARAELLGLHEILDAGHLNCLEAVLHGAATAHLLKSGTADDAKAVDEIKRLLADRRMEEAAGGTGSLVVADHSFTVTLIALELPLG